jgi:hypothetical protein
MNDWIFYHTGVLPGEGRDSTVVFVFGCAYQGAAGRVPTELLLETQSSVEGGCDIDHVYALEEFMPGRGSPERHSSRGVLPYGNHDARQVGSCGAALERLLDPRLFRWRSFSKRPIDGDDDHVLTVSPQMCYLKGRHCIHRSCRRFRHVPWRIQPAVEMVNVDSISPNCLFSIKSAVGTVHARVMGYLSSQ